MHILDFEPAGQLEYAELGLKGTVLAFTFGETEHLSSSGADPANGRRIKIIIGISSHTNFNNNNHPLD
jgi:hypothetical protein